MFSVRRLLVGSCLEYKLNVSCFTKHVCFVNSTSVTVRELPQELLSELEKTKNYKVEEWRYLRSKLINNHYLLRQRNLNSVNVDSVILNYLRLLKLFDGCINYYQTIKNEEIHFGVLGKLCLAFSDELKEGTDPEKYKHLILEIYNKIKAQSTVLDSHTADYCIRSIVYYEEIWRDVFQLFDNIKIVSEPTSNTFNSIIYGCFVHNEPELGWSYWNQMINSPNEKKISNEIYVSIINHCLKLKKTDSKQAVTQLERLFTFMSDNDLALPLELSSSLQNCLKSLDNKYTSNISTLHSTCSYCKTKLILAESKNEIQNVCEAFFKDAMLGSNVFLKSTPEEMKKFVNFVDKTCPYNIVVDGLNISHQTSSKSPKIRSQLLKTVVQNLVEKSKTVLVVGRKHMASWPKVNMEYIFRHAHVFLAENLSHDDPLVLYAALKSGWGTGFVSQDLMRNHMFKLKDKTQKKLFQIWCVSHRHEVMKNKYGKVYVQVWITHQLIDFIDIEVTFGVESNRDLQKIVKICKNIHRNIMIDPTSFIGQHITALPTPAFLVSKTKVEKNCRKMLETCKRLNIKLRAHTKTHKTIEGALLQQNNARKGFVVSTLQEAAFYAENGFDDILYGFPLMQQHAERCFKIMQVLNEFHVMINNEAGLEVVENNSPPPGKKWSVFIKIRVGYKRAGILHTDFDRVLTLAHKLNSNSGVEFQGLYVHCGDSYNSENVECVRDEAVERLVQLRNKLTRHGVTCRHVGIGSTPSCSLQTNQRTLDKLTEIHPGNYVFYDCQQENYGSCELNDIAVRVMTRIVSHHPDINVLLVDLGFTGLTKQGFNLLNVPGYGRVRDENQRDGLMLNEMSQEIGKVTTIDNSAIDFQLYPVGSRLFVYPYHACATSGLYPIYYVHNDEEIITATWTPTRGW